MATTTTFHAIRDNLVTLIEAIAPSLMTATGQEFRRVPDGGELIDFAEHGTSAVFRKFEVRLHPDRRREEPPFMDPSAYEVNEWARIVVAYPVLPEMYGANHTTDIEKVMWSDAMQIRDKVFNPSGYLAGQSLARVEIGAPSTEDPLIWYQPFDVLLIYTAAQTLY